MNDYTLLAPHHFVREPEPKKEDFSTDTCSTPYIRTFFDGEREFTYCYDVYEKALQEHKRKYVKPETKLGVPVNQEEFDKDLSYYTYYQVLFPEFTLQIGDNGTIFRKEGCHIYFYNSGAVTINTSRNNDPICQCTFWEGILIELFRLIIRENGL